MVHNICFCKLHLTFFFCLVRFGVFGKPSSPCPFLMSFQIHPSISANISSIIHERRYFIHPRAQMFHPPMRANISSIHESKHFIRRPHRGSQYSLECQCWQKREIPSQHTKPSLFTTLAPSAFHFVGFGTRSQLDPRLISNPLSCLLLIFRHIFKNMAWLLPTVELAVRRPRPHCVGATTGIVSGRLFSSLLLAAHSLDPSRLIPIRRVCGCMRVVWWRLDLFWCADMRASVFAIRARCLKVYMILFVWANSIGITISVVRFSRRGCGLEIGDV